MKRMLVGVMPEAKHRARVMAIAAGRYTPKHGEPKIWFHSLKSLTEVLSDKNRALLKMIAEYEPENIGELARMSGRAPSNLGRTLRTFEQHGFVHMVQIGKAKRPVAKVVDFDIRLEA